MTSLVRRWRAFLARGDSERSEAKLRADLITYDAPEDGYVLIVWCGLYATLIETALEQSGIPTRIAHSDSEALEKVYMSRPAAVVCYARHEPQGAGGPRLIGALRGDSDLEALPILVLVRPGDEGGVDAVRASGAADVYSDTGALVNALRLMID